MYRDGHSELTTKSSGTATVCASETHVKRARLERGDVFVAEPRGQLTVKVNHAVLMVFI